MTDRELTDIVYTLSERFEKVNTRYLEQMGQHIREIGKLSPIDVHRVEQYMRMSANIDKLKTGILQAANLTMKDFDDTVDQMLLDEYSDNKLLFDFANKNYTDLIENEVLLQHIQAIRELTANSLQNIANTTVLQTNYQDLVDKGIYSVSNGLESYNSVIRNTLKQNAVGARVTYASGITRRLDSAVRMNILDGTRQVWNEIHERSGEVFGADGYELSAHALCAEDHLPVQGKQFSFAEFEKLQNDQPFEDYEGTKYQAIQRPIGQWNCKHITFPIILGISQPANSEEMLKQYAEYSNGSFEINGRNYTRYQCSQLMRRAETSMRYSKDGYILAKASGDDELAQQYQDRLLMQQAKYRQIADTAGLKREYGRAYVPGYRGSGNNSKPKVVERSSNISTNSESLVVNAKDVTGSWERRENVFGDTIHDVLEYQKFDGLPILASSTKFTDFAAKSNIIGQRVYVANTQAELDTWKQSLYTGEWHVRGAGGNARYGRGMYVFSNTGTTVSDMVKNNITKYENLYMDRAIRNGHTDAVGTVETITMHQSSRIVKYEDLMEPYDSFIKSSKYNYNTLDIGSFAALKGYDAISVPNEVTGDILIVLNRTKLVIMLQ